MCLTLSTGAALTEASSVPKSGSPNSGDRTGVPSSMMVSNVQQAHEGAGGGAAFSSIYQKDAYLLFRALCKLSMKGLNEEASNSHSSNDPIAMQNK